MCFCFIDVFFVVCLLSYFFRFISLWGDTPVWFHQCSLDHQLVVAKMDMWFHCSFRGWGQVINASENGFHLAQFFRDTFIRHKVFETTIGRGSHAWTLLDDWNQTEQYHRLVVLKCTLKIEKANPQDLCIFYVWCIYLIYRTWILWETSSQIAIWFKAILTILTSLISKLDELVMKFLVLNS